MSENDQFQDASLALFFDGEMTLRQMAEILTEVDDAYRACAEVVAPGVEAPTTGLQVVVSSGSLFIELMSVAQPATWVASTIVLMKWLINDGRAIAALPYGMIKSFQDSKEEFGKTKKGSVVEKAENGVKKLKSRRPLTGDQAIRKRKTITPTPEATTTPRPASSEKHSSAPHSVEPFKALPKQSFKPVGSSGSGISIVKTKLMTVADFADENHSSCATLASAIERAVAYLASDMVGGNPVTDAASVLMAAKESVEKLIGKFIRVRDSLSEYAGSL